MDFAERCPDIRSGRRQLLLRERKTLGWRHQGSRPKSINSSTHEWCSWTYISEYFVHSRWKLFLCPILEGIISWPTSQNIPYPIFGSLSYSTFKNLPAYIPYSVLFRKIFCKYPSFKVLNPHYTITIKSHLLWNNGYNYFKWVPNLEITNVVENLYFY